MIEDRGGGRILLEDPLIVRTEKVHARALECTSPTRLGKNGGMMGRRGKGRTLKIAN